MSTDDGDTSARDRRALEFLRKARGLRGLSAAAMERIERRLQRGQEDLLGSAGKRRPRKMALVAVAAAVALLAGGTLALAHVGWRNLPFVGPLFAPHSHNGRPAPRDVLATQNSAVAESASLSEPSPSLGAGAGRAPSLAPAEKAPTTNEALGHLEAERNHPASQKGVAVRPRADGNPSRPLAAPEAVVDPILAESQSFATAIALWHRDHDGRAALATLDAHEQRFPAGHLLVEARVLRAEILLSQGRERESLMLLDRMTLGGSPRARELFTVRGELRIKLGRCADGRTDLDEVLSKSVADGFAKRAVQALGHCP